MARLYDYIHLQQRGCTLSPPAVPGIISHIVQSSSFRSSYILLLFFVSCTSIPITLFATECSSLGITPIHTISIIAFPEFFFEIPLTFDVPLILSFLILSISIHARPPSHNNHMSVTVLAYNELLGGGM